MTSSTVISLFALGVAILSLYLQRRDKKPRLRVDFERAMIEISKTGAVGGTYYQPYPGLIIRARNQTERDIKVERTYFVDARGKCFQVPSDWKTVTEVPSYQSRPFEISVAKFNKWAKDVKISEPKRGRFVLSDGVPNQYKSRRLGDSLSMAVVNKLPGEKV